MAIKYFSDGDNLSEIAKAIPTAIQGYYDAKARGMAEKEMQAKLAASELATKRQKAMDVAKLQSEGYEIPQGEQDVYGLMGKGLLERRKGFLDPNELKQQETLANIDYKRAQTGKALSDTGTSKSQRLFEEAKVKQYAKQATEWNTKDRQALQANVSKINNAVNILTNEKGITGPMIGMLGEKSSAFLNPKGLEAQQFIQSAVQDTLRPTLGAQFTEKEGERIMSLAYNPRLSQEVNKKRALQLKQIIDKKIAGTDALFKHIQKFGTDEGFEFSKYDMTMDGAEDAFNLDEYKAKVSERESAGPKVGSVVDGYEFMGGDPADQNNWEKK